MYQILSIRYRVSDIEYQISSIKYQASDMEYQMASFTSIRYRVSGPGLANMGGDGGDHAP